MEAPEGYGFGSELEKAVRDGKVPESWVDTAVRRILRHKFQMGLFDDPFSRCWFAAVYKGEKEKFCHFSHYAINGTAAPGMCTLEGRGQQGLLLSSAKLGAEDLRSNA